MKIRYQLIVGVYFSITLIACTNLPPTKTTDTSGKKTNSSHEEIIDEECLLTDDIDVNLVVPENIQLKLGIALTAQEAYGLVEKEGKNSLFIDVRTPAETESGMPVFVDANIPYALREWYNEKPIWVSNADFIPAIEERLEEKNLGKENTIILICSQGTRSAKAVDLLIQLGYKKAYSITGGINQGWKKHNLPWSDELDIEQMYLN